MKQDNQNANILTTVSMNTNGIHVWEYPSSVGYIIQRLGVAFMTNFVIDVNICY